MYKAQQVSLMRWSLQAERIAKGHISSQDLGWKPLSAKTIMIKSDKGLSENILVATSSYFRSITGWVDGDTAYVGVKKGVREENGTEIEKVALVLEFGSDERNIPERPLWRPTMAEVSVWTYKNNNPVNIFYELIR